MKLLLAFLLSMVVIGLVTDRLDGRAYALVTGAAVLVTAMYFTMTRWSV